MRLDIELLRIISAFGIVWFHSGIKFGHEVSYGGLIVFIILSIYFTMISNKKSLLTKALRLLIPCLVWSAIYASFSYVRGADIFPQNFNIVSKILSTPSIHLWYLPFIFFVTLLIKMLKKYVPINNIRVISILLAIITLLTAQIWRDFNYISPFGQWAHAFPAVLIGIFLGTADKINHKRFYILLLFALASIIYVTILNVKDVGITYLIGVIPCLILLLRNSLLKSNQFIFSLSSTTFGIYLLHPLVLFIFQYFGIVGFVLPLLAFTVSLIVIYIAKLVLPKGISVYIF